MRHKVALFTTIITFIALCLGNLVVATHSGDACGHDYPKCNGQFIPDFTSYNIVIEYSHRIFTGLLGFVILFNSIYAWKKKIPGETAVKVFAILSSFLLFLQGATGGINVMLGTPPGFTTLDVANSLLLMISLVFLTVILERKPIIELEIKVKQASHVGMKRISLIGFVILFVQTLIGAFFKHSGASELIYIGTPQESLIHSIDLADAIYNLHGIMVTVVFISSLYLLFAAIQAGALVRSSVTLFIIMLLTGLTGFVTSALKIPEVSSSIHMMFTISMISILSYIFAKLHFGIYVVKR